MTLTRELEEFVKSKVRGGGYANASEVVREALRILQRHERYEDPNLEAYLLEAARQPRRRSPMMTSSAFVAED